MVCRITAEPTLSTRNSRVLDVALRHIRYAGGYDSGQLVRILGALGFAYEKRCSNDPAVESWIVVHGRVALTDRPLEYFERVSGDGFIGADDDGDTVIAADPVRRSDVAAILAAHEADRKWRYQDAEKAA